MKTTVLGSIIEIAKGKKVEQLYPTNGLAKSLKRYIQIDDLRNDRNIKYTDSNGVQVIAEDLIIAWDGANAGTIGHNLEGVIGSTLARLRILDSNYDSKFLAKFLQSKFIYLRSQCTGATIPHISRSVLIKLKIPLLPLPEQKRIAKILDKADSIRQKRKESIALLYEFLRSVFLDLFGDPVKNEKGWEKNKIGNLASVSMGGTPNTRILEYYGGDINWMKSGDIKGNFIYTIRNKITQLGLINSNTKIYKKNSVVIALNGQGKTRGTTSVLKLETASNQSVANFELNINLINPIYLHFNLKLRYLELRNMTGNDERSGLNLSILRNLHIYNPPINLQTQFAKIVEQVETTKSKMEESLREMDNQFNGLLQRAFGGEQTIDQVNYKMK